MDIYYDTEFLEDGQTIELISIGLVAADGREYYAVSKDMPKRRIRRHEWLMANVVPSLPKAFGDARLYQPRRWLFNYSDPCVKPRHVIAREVRDFILVTPAPALWASCGAYDHVVLSQLWGRMADHPEGVPMWTNDLQQEWSWLGRPDLPQQAEGEHNALADARHNRVVAEFLREYAAGLVL